MPGRHLSLDVRAARVQLPFAYGIGGVGFCSAGNCGTATTRFSGLDIPSLARSCIGERTETVVSGGDTSRRYVRVAAVGHPCRIVVPYHLALPHDKRALPNERVARTTKLLWQWDEFGDERWWHQGLGLCRGTRSPRGSFKTVLV